MMEARACAWLVVLGLESAALSLGPAKKDEESAKSPGPLSSGAYPLVGGSHEADASTADSGGQSVRLLQTIVSTSRCAVVQFLSTDDSVRLIVLVPF